MFDLARFCLHGLKITKLSASAACPRFRPPEYYGAGSHARETRSRAHNAEPRERAAAPVTVSVRTATAACHTTAASAAAGTWRPRRAATAAQRACCAASARRVATALVGTLRGWAAGRVPLAGRLAEQSRRLDWPAAAGRAEDCGRFARGAADRDHLLQRDRCYHGQGDRRDEAA